MSSSRFLSRPRTLLDYARVTLTDSDLRLVSAKIDSLASNASCARSTEIMLLGSVTDFDRSHVSVPSGGLVRLFVCQTAPKDEAP